MPTAKFPTTTLEPGDRERWTELWRAYLTFYQTELPDDTYEATWSRIVDPNGAIHALGVRDNDGRLVGITHFLTHSHAWSRSESCYLQDLFVDEAVRGQGYARALINGVAAAARLRNCCSLYWITHETNTTARLLYDSLAKNTGFIRYDFAL
jgi:GNAT superfamily N-acetyltransferase